MGQSGMVQNVESPEISYGEKLKNSTKVRGTIGKGGLEWIMNIDSLRELQCIRSNRTTRHDINLKSIQCG